MENILNFFAEYWMFIILAIAIITCSIYLGRKFNQKPTDEKIECVKAWLLSAVTAAEKEFGSGTGALKLSSVYGQFVQVFPSIAKIITFATFSSLVDQVLVTFRNMLENNKNVQGYVKGGEQ